MNSKQVKKTKYCRVCNSLKLFNFFSMGEMPIPNGFISKELLDEKEDYYPLEACLCEDCYLVQLRYIVNPSIMFKNYLYIPSSSKTRIEHFNNLAKSVINKIVGNKNMLVVDIGSNDGSLLTSFKNLGFRVLGVDPAENLVEVAKLNGIDTILGFFNVNIAKKIVKNNMTASVITATNVFAHIDDLNSLLSAIDVLLDKDGVFVCQFPYLLDLIKKNLFDTIYHEHLSYFSLNPIMRLSERSKLQVFDVERNDLDGGSLRIFWKKKINKSIKIKNKNIKKILLMEKKYGLYNKKTYLKFTKRVEKLKNSLKNKLIMIKKQNKKIVGYGAAAKGNILLNYFGITSEILDYIVDSTPYKQGLFTPGIHIPIYHESKIYETKPEYILVLAWNFSEEIIKKNQEYKLKYGNFILPVPKVKII